MTETQKFEKTYPYPPRASELVQSEDFLTPVDVINLSPEERQILLEFEEPFYSKLKEIKKIEVVEHTIYPNAFQTEEGRRLFALVYLDESIWNKITDVAQNRGIDLKDKEVKERVWTAVFEDLKGIAEDKDSFTAYRDTGVGFVNLSRELGIGEGSEAVAFVGSTDAGNLNEVDIKAAFVQADLRKIPKDIRKRTNDYSSDFAKGVFVEEYNKRSGDVSEIPNPEKLTKIVNLSKLTTKVRGLRDLKKEIKELRKETIDPSELGKAKALVLEMYQSAVNFYLADLYPHGRIVGMQETVSTEEKEALRALAGQDSLEGRFSPGQASRTVRRVDAFLQGVGLQVGGDGLLKPIPQALESYVEQKIRENPAEITAKYKKYNAQKVNAEQAKVLCEFVLGEYDAYKGEKPWKVKVVVGKSAFSVNGEKKEVRIPEKLKRGLVDCLAVVAHEVEGHTLRYLNQEKIVDKGLKLMGIFTPGRSHILSEAAAVKIEDRTKQEMAGVGRRGEGYYYIALREKARGGTFRECFDVFLRAYAKRKYGLDLSQVLEDDEKYRETIDNTYPRVMRIFRHFTPLDDKSGYITTSSQLSYIEQEMVADVLDSKGMLKLLSVGGIDLFSIQDLTRLGMFDISSVQEPKMVVARVLWPRLKKGIDEGKSLDEAISALE